MAVEREVADALEVTNDARKVIYVLRATMGTFLEIALVNLSTILTERVGNIEGEVVTSFLRSNTKELTILRFAKMLLNVEVNC